MRAEAAKVQLAAAVVCLLGAQPEGLQQQPEGLQQGLPAATASPAMRNLPLRL